MLAAYKIVAYRKSVVCSIRDEKDYFKICEAVFVYACLYSVAR